MYHPPLLERLESRQLFSANPLVAHGVRVAAVEGQALSNVLVSTFKDNPADPLANYSATIAWGDGSTSAGAIAVNTAGGFDVTGSHTYVARGHYRALVQIADTDGHSAKAIIVERALNAPITATGKDVSATVGLAFQGVVATYSDADPRSANGPVLGQTAIIRWGDGTASMGTVTLNSSTHLLEVTGKHPYGKAKVFAIKTLIREPGVTPTIATASATVAAPTPTLTPSLVGTFKGTAKAKGGGFFDKVIGDLVGDQTFEFDMTGQTLDSITGTLSIAGHSVSGTLNGVLLNNRKFHFVLSSDSGDTEVTLQALISVNGLVIAGQIEAKFSALSDHEFKGEFTATRQ